MAWSTRFFEQLAGAKLEPRVILEVVNISGAPGGSGSLAEVVVGKFSVSPQSVTPGSWASTVGGFRCEVQYDDPGPLLQVLRRGSIVRLLMGFGDWDRSLYEPIAAGRVRNVSGLAPTFMIDCLDLFSACVSRPEASDLEALQLFAGAGKGDTLSGAYAVDDATVSVSDLSLYEKDTLSVYGAVRITPNTGDPFYLLWSGKSGSSGSGTLTVHAPTSDRFGTTRDTADSGNVVEPIAYLEGHPIAIARRVLTSTGQARNGPDDSTPKSWGLGLPHWLLDRPDSIRYESLVTHAAGSGYRWGVLVDSPQQNGWSWLRELLRRGGMFATMRQGSVTIRAAHGVHSAPLDTNVHLEGRDLRGDPAHQWWDVQVPTEHGGIRIYGTGGTIVYGEADDVATTPALRYQDWDLTEVSWYNVADVCEELRGRLRPWALTVPERATLPVVDRQLAGLAPGDVLRVSDRRICGRHPEGETWSRQPVWVASVDPGWTRSGPDIQVSAPPPEGSRHG